MNCLPFKPNPAPIKARFLPVAVLTLLILPATTLPAQSPGQLYALGVNMGLASYQVSAVETGNNLPYVRAALDETGKSLYAASTIKDAIDNSAGGRSLSDSGANLKDLTSRVLGYPQGHNFTDYKRDSVELQKRIERLRDGYSAQLQSRGIPMLYSAYLLGVHLGIAEGLASSNNDLARSDIDGWLNKAKTHAKALGLDPRPLKECHDYLFGQNPSDLMNNRYSSSLNEIHWKIISARSYYQGLLK